MAPEFLDWWFEFTKGGQFDNFTHIFPKATHEKKCFQLQGRDGVMVMVINCNALQFSK